MISSDRVIEHSQDSRTVNILHRFGFLGHALEEGWLLNIGRVGIPFEEFACGVGEGTPAFIALKHGCVVLREHFGSDGFSDQLAYFFRCGPDIPQVDRLAFVVCAYGVFSQVDINSTGERIGHHERRRGEKAGTHLWVNTSLKVAITTEHSRDHKIVFLDGLSNGIEQGTTITDTGCAAVANQVEAQLVQVGCEAGGVKIVDNGT